ncbi:hypothetical protein MJO28_017159 [Puccinia striiformis f. sp. tritici]|uniref:hypothetical protein n=1 Tax=Puccinia striiformis f. sp. tritici TaxID=168172 RepID=UPI0020082DAF|nr:hypothetical protein Pst134EA_019511 [Puccinia striiformis f. sp. tritici]KAH9459359.1 hypothetical protein Pst134EA_019511 [Puccinia striiformis f. sp. tritici]KAI7934313.1 hypothetical protein MJO28_017159 [Puccinia striiformis f. sp. tritici]KAI7948771.1 hypothetical protein MJO29_010436 [Puccinia striiformis f. sp. tritici]KAI9618758.1 hypothetical protein KEM48_006523 [Puccinia striiformis f. sp. tritici PST-130]
MQLLMIGATLIASLCFLEGFSPSPIHHKHLQGRSAQAQYNRDGPQRPRIRPQARPRLSIYTDNPMMTTSYNPFIRPQDRPKHAMRVDRNSVHKAGSFWDFGGQARPYTSDFQSS